MNSEEEIPTQIRRTPEQIQQLVAAFRRSGQTIGQFAQQQALLQQAKESSQSALLGRIGLMDLQQASGKRSLQLARAARRGDQGHARP